MRDLLLSNHNLSCSCTAFWSVSCSCGCRNGALCSPSPCRAERRYKMAALCGSPFSEDLSENLTFTVDALDFRFQTEKPGCNNRLSTFARRNKRTANRKMEPERESKSSVVGSNSLSGFGGKFLLKVSQQCLKETSEQ